MENPSSSTVLRLFFFLLANGKSKEPSATSQEKLDSLGSIVLAQ
jgi:hypothetical protein